MGMTDAQFFAYQKRILRQLERFIEQMLGNIETGLKIML